MPTIELTSDTLIVHLSIMEKIFSARGNLHIPLSNVRGATEDSGFNGESLGLRLPGTNIPGFLRAGTFFGNSEWQFVYLKPSLQPLVVELRDEKYTRLAIGVPDARELAKRINAAIASPLSPI